MSIPEYELLQVGVMVIGETNEPPYCGSIMRGLAINLNSKISLCKNRIGVSNNTTVTLIQGLNMFRLRLILIE